MVGEYDLGAVGDEELAIWSTRDGKAGIFEFFDLGEEGHGVEYDAVADDAFALRPEDAAGDELEHELPALDDDGVTGIVPASVAGDDIELLGEDVDDLSFALIAPLGTEDYR
ncbi:MAG: hypothetical protein NVSMB3_01770 [Acidobacteriaceae bacterium]